MQGRAQQTRMHTHLDSADRSRAASQACTSTIVSCGPNTLERDHKKAQYAAGDGLTAGNGCTREREVVCACAREACACSPALESENSFKPFDTGKLSLRTHSHTCHQDCAPACLRFRSLRSAAGPGAHCGARMSLTTSAMTVGSPLAPFALVSLVECSDGSEILCRSKILNLNGGAGGLQRSMQPFPSDTIIVF